MIKIIPVHKNGYKAPAFYLTQDEFDSQERDSFIKQKCTLSRFDCWTFKVAGKS